MQCNKDRKCGDSVIMYCALLCTAPIFMSFLVLLLSISIWCISIFWVNIVPSVTQAFIQNIGGVFFLNLTDCSIITSFEQLFNILARFCFFCAIPVTIFLRL